MKQHSRPTYHMFVHRDKAKRFTAGRKERTHADPQTSENHRDDEHSTETARCCSDHSPDQQFDGEDRGEQDLAFHRAERKRSEQDVPPRRHYYEGANDPICVADSSDQDELEDAKEDCRFPTDTRH